jgi:hypothetical protein
MKANIFYLNKRQVRRVLIVGTAPPGNKVNVPCVPCVATGRSLVDLDAVCPVCGGHGFSIVNVQLPAPQNFSI